MRGARVSPSGTMHDGPDGFQISAGSGGDGYPVAVAFGDTNYLAVWGGASLRGALVTKDGLVSSEFPISGRSSAQQEPSLAFDGTNYMVVWRDTVGQNYDDADIYAARVSAVGTVLDPQGIPVSTATSKQSVPKIAYDGTNYFAVWLDSRNSGYPSYKDIYGARITPDGVLLDGPSRTGGFAINTNRYSDNENMGASLIFDGSNYFVVWNVYSYVCRNPAGIFGARVSSSGVLIDGPSEGMGIVLSGSPPNCSSYGGANIVFSGQNSLLTWVWSRTGTAPPAIEGVLIDPL